MDYQEFDQRLRDENVIIEEVDWNRYRELFPKRYFRKTQFDVYVESEIMSRECDKNSKLLDVGSGKYPCNLPEYRKNYWTFLDKHIEAPWVCGWNDLEKYDVIRCRGSLLYLNSFEIHSALFSLRDGGVFLANFPFDIERDSLRKYETMDGWHGWERALYSASMQSIRHYLLPDDSYIAYTHTLIGWTPKLLHKLVLDVGGDAYFRTEFLVFGKNTGVFKVTRHSF